MNGIRTRSSKIAVVSLGLWALTWIGCTASHGKSLFSDPGFLLNSSLIAVYYNDPGIDHNTGTDKKIDQRMVKLMENAETSIDLAVYNLGREAVIEGVTIARERNIQVRMVGDVDEVVTDGYRSILRTDIPFSLGNSSAIQHNKFAVIDKKYIFMGTGNMTNSGFLRNNNNFWIIESETLAKAYTDEFEQMYFGKYGSKKNPLTANFKHQIDFTPIELYFSPYNGQDAMDRLIALAGQTRGDLKYMIFADTHDELTTARIRAARRGVLVRGIHDSTFVRGTSEEAPRIYAASQYIPNLQVRRDGNEHTSIVGLASHGGKLHTKTMIFDDSIVCTGSFNWSGNAVENNDENMVCIFNPFLTAEVVEQWNSIWAVSKPVSDILTHPSGDKANFGDVIITEVMWAGSYSSSSSFNESDDDWIELYNTTTQDIDLSHWTLTWDSKETVFYPIPDEFNWYKPGVASTHYFTGKLVIPAGGYFLLKAQNESIDSYDNKISGTKNFELSSSALHLRLYDARMQLIDEVGNGDPPAAGGLKNSAKKAWSMERFVYPTGHAQAGQYLPGTSPGSWYDSNGNNGQVETGTFCSAGSPAARTVCGTGDFFSTHNVGTIGTPNYSGSTPVSASNAYGAYHQNLNTPREAWATSSTSAIIQMRWALTAAPTVTTASGICAYGGGTCTASLDSTDPSKVIVTTDAQVAGATLTLNVAAGSADVSNPGGGGTIFGGLIGFTGFGSSKATVQINRVGPAESSSEDIIEVIALTSGNVRGLGIYYYEPGFGVFPPVLLYRMADINMTAGQKILLTLDKPLVADTEASEDRYVQGRCSVAAGNCFSGPTFSITAQGTGAADTWEVFSSVPGIQKTDGIIMVSYSLDQTPQDVMCYSDRSGDVLEGLMKGGFRTLYSYGSAVYVMPVFPVDGNNDFVVESACSDFSEGTSAGHIMVRQTDTNQGSDFTCPTC